MAPLKSIFALVGLLCCCIAGCHDPVDLRGSIDANEPVAIDPDFDGAAIPPNIAPLNFTVQKSGIRYAVDFRARGGETARVASFDPAIRLPLALWKNLLRKNAGETLTVVVSVKDKKAGWRTFRSRSISIMREPIDPYLVFRQLKPAYNWWREMAIIERDLGSFQQNEIISGRETGCVNCHTFLNNRPDTFLISARNRPYGNAAILNYGNKAVKIDATFGYLSWHPSGRFITYTDMQPRQFFHTARLEIRDVIDVREHLMNFDLKRRVATPLPSFTGPRTLETYPAWTPDGKTLFFCACPIPWDSSADKLPTAYRRVKYSLCKVSYNQETGNWGQVQTMVSAKFTGLSCAMPRVSPNGRFVLFCQCDYGCFPAFQKSADLYLLTIASGECRPLTVNSNESESWHCWSSNSRWIAFSSKRRDGVFTRIYFSYIDSCGKARAPFELPQKDPGWYDSFLEAMSVPELTTGPIAVHGEILRAAARANGIPPTSGEAATDTTVWR
jgi:hypothetical protein